MNKPTNVSSNNLDTSINVGDLLGLLWVKKWVIIFMTGCVFLLGLLFISKLPDVYRASTTIMVKAERTDNPLQTLVTGQIGIQEELDTTIKLIKSIQFANVLIDKIKQQYSGLQYDKVLNDEKEFLKVLSIQPVPNTHMLELSFEHTDANFAAFVVNLIATSFIEYELSLMQPHADKSDEWIRTKIQEVKDKLDEEESKLNDFRQNNNIVDIVSFVSLAKQDISQLHEQKRALTLEAEKLARVINTLANHANPDSALVISQWSDVETLKILSKQQAKLETELSQIKLRYLEKHPKYKAKVTEIEGTRQQLALEFEKLSDGLKHKLSEINQSIKSLDLNRIAAEQQLEQAILKNLAFEKIKRSVSATTQLLESITAKQKEVELFKDINHASSIIIVDPALEPEKPVRPKRILLAAVVLFIGLALSLLVIFIAKILGNSHKKYYQLVRAYDLDVLGELPVVSRFRRYKRGLIFSNENEGDYRLFEECIRSIRTRMLLSDGNEQDKIIAISSLEPGEGKSNFALLLAKSISEVEDVIVIDADLREHSITVKLGYEPSQPGLTNFLAKIHTFEQCVIKDPTLKADVFASGILPKKPQLFLSLSRFENMLKALSKKYDRVILNCPPLFFASDIMLISKHVNTINLIVDVQKHTVTELENELDQLVYTKSKVNSVIFNKIKVEHKNYYRRVKHPKNKK
ncbi:Tyrosine-protein kinase ptk [Pseudoalteromonas sp. P1-9]|uniref:GumC family protein n=1 Tax=Pseudoalteromonas sp. P1-9 TaxID=1710354 RepID=UPI0006D5F921|nr:polysaccharide biosynthesis tyrosine autokinase [Pseudoalteromonas sp. P1-9]KPV97006.1 Tyrosine-protein kinase ptk [Pseudoalteromonas sp. P1-9]